MKLWMVSLISVIFFSKIVNAVSILENVSTKFNRAGFIAELKFNKELKSEKVEIDYINQTVQVNIPNATVRKGKHFIRVNEGSIKSVYSYQFEKDVLRIRIIYDTPFDSSLLEGHVNIKKSGSALFITIPDLGSIDEFQSRINTYHRPRDISSNIVNMSRIEEESENLLKNTKELPQKLPEKNFDQVHSNDLSLNSFEVKESEKKEEADTYGNLEKNTPVFRKKLTSEKMHKSNFWSLLYSLIIVGFIGVALVLFARWWNKNNKINDKNTKIQILTQHHLGPRKSLMIVRVAGESLLLGVTDSQINMIKTLSFIDDEIVENPPDNFGKVFESENEKGEKEIKTQKVTFAPDLDLVKDLRKQITGKLKNMKSI